MPRAAAFGAARLAALLALPALAAAAPERLADLVPATAALGALSFTGSSCRHVASGLRVSRYPAAPAGGGGGDRVLPAARLGLRGADACAEGELVFSGAAPAASLANGTLDAYELFVRVVERDWPAALRDISRGRVSGCPASARGAETGDGGPAPASVAVTSVLLFTPPDGDSAVSALADGDREGEEGASDLFRGFGVAEDVLYAAVQFDLIDASEEELAGFPCGDRCRWRDPAVREDAGGRLAFHCFYAEDVAAADAAARSVEAEGDEVPELPGDDDPIFQRNRNLSVGEGVGIACGFLLSAALITTFLVRRRRLNREEQGDPSMMPTLG